MTSLEPRNPPEMSPEAHAAVTKLNRLAYELSQREPLIKRRLDYLTGKHTLKYASPEFDTYFGARFKGFSDNWCAPVINGPTERMNFLGVRLNPEQPDTRELVHAAAGDAEGARPAKALRDVDKDLERVWRANDADASSSKAFVMMLAASRAFVTVWGDEKDETTPMVTFERPDQAVVEYGDRGQRVSALKLWRDDKHEYATIDTGDYLWKFIRTVIAQDGRLRSGLVLPSTAIGGWEPREVPGEVWPLPNPLGEPCTVEIANNDLLDRDNPMSDIDGVIAMQDAINLVWAYLMNGLDYATLPQRVVTGADVPQVPVLDAQGQVVGRRPVELDELIKDRILWVPNPNAKTGEWSSANLDVFSRVIEQAIEHLSAQTRTPPHYLIGKIQNVAADALTAAETGLVAKTRERTTYANPGLRGANRLIALAQGDEGKAKAIRSGTMVWDDFQYRALGQKVDALVKLHKIGFPFEWIAEQYGLPPLEVERVVRMREAEKRDAQLDDIARIERFGEQIEAVGVGVRAGFKPKALTDAVGLPEIDHTGRLPITVQDDEQQPVPVNGSEGG